MEDFDNNPLSVFAKECILGSYTDKELPNAARLALERNKNRTWNELTEYEIETLISEKVMDFRMTYHELIRNAIEIFKEKNT